MKRIVRIAGAVLCLALAAFFLLPLTVGTVHIGMLYPAVLLALAALALLFPSAVQRLFRSRWRKLAAVGAALLGIAVACVLVMCLRMDLATENHPAEEQEVTVLVLGCQVAGDRPSIMLRGRIEAAYNYLADHPETVCIATGGQGTGENISEAECIRQELIAMGIDAQRIYIEDRSTNTLQNIILSSIIIDEHNLPTTVALASDNFHQFRAAYYARQWGLEPLALGCESPWYLGAGYWAREVLALVKIWLLGLW